MTLSHCSIFWDWRIQPKRQLIVNSQFKIQFSCFFFVWLRHIRIEHLFSVSPFRFFVYVFFFRFVYWLIDIHVSVANDSFKIQYIVMVGPCSQFLKIIFSTDDNETHNFRSNLTKQNPKKQQFLSLCGSNANKDETIEAFNRSTMRKKTNNGFENKYLLFTGLEYRKNCVCNAPITIQFHCYAVFGEKKSMNFIGSRT